MTNKFNDKTLIHKGSHISLYKQKVPLPDDRHTFYDVIIHPGGAVMAAIDDKNRLCLITQPRPAVGEDVWEFPAGCLEPNEPPLATAKRELEEETGFVATDWFDLGSIVTAPGYCDEILHLFAAKKLTETVTNFDDEEQIESHWLTIEEVDEKINNGQINDAKTLSLLYKIRTHPELSKLWKN
jgi:ADP-ribose pyrophosphatase